MDGLISVGDRAARRTGIFHQFDPSYEVGAGERPAPTARWVHAWLSGPGLARQLAAQAPARPMSVLREAIDETGRSRMAAWLRYFTFGGAADPVEFEAYLDEALVASARDHSMIDHAIWEIEQGWT